MNINFWKNRNVFITGHTGFKGGWTSLWLASLGANVYGYSLEPTTRPNFFFTTGLKKLIKKSTYGNILNIKHLTSSIKNAKPSVVIHMAAQPIVRISYNNPVDTYLTNVIGTVNLFEAVRKSKINISAVINVTSDKVYENNENKKPFKETDVLGGYDPYSNSKSCSELITNSYKKSFFDKSSVKVASVRSGNIIGGGDWARDRLVPDFFRSVKNRKSLLIRSPNSIRPWQHVIEPIFGYLTLAEKLVKGGKRYVGAWNFGPQKKNVKTVYEIIKYLNKKVSKSNFHIDKRRHPHEAINLNLDSSKSNNDLGWLNIWNIEKALNKTIEWHDSWSNSENMASKSLDQINDYMKMKKNKKI